MEDWKEIAICPDGSGKAGDYHRTAIELIEEREAVLLITRAFIEKHKVVLAGLFWAVGYLEPEIKVGYSYYRGNTTTPKDIAKLWPGVKWQRKRCKWNDGYYDYLGVVDGITIRIERAESEKPQPKKREGAVNLAD